MQMFLFNKLGVNNGYVCVNTVMHMFEHIAIMILHGKETFHTVLGGKVSITIWILMNTGVAICVFQVTRGPVIITI